MAEKQSNLDELANILYRADMKAEGDPMVSKWEHLGEPWVSRYRAMAAAAAQFYKQEGNAKLDAIETAIQLLTGNILNLRTELLVIKAVVVKNEDEQERQDSQKYIEHYYEGGD